MLSPSAVSPADRCASGTTSWAWPWTRAGDHDVPGLFSHVESVDAGELRLHLLGRWNAHVLRMVSADQIEAAASGDATAQRSLRRASYPDEAQWQKAMRHVLRTDPEHLRG